MSDVTSSRGGAGRGQGRRPISEDGVKAYKLLLTDEQRIKLDKLGNATWIRQQIDFATYLESLDMSAAVNLSARYIRALRQLPQFAGSVNHGGPLIHLALGHQVLPLGDLTDEHDDSGLLEIVYPGGLRNEVIGHMYYMRAIKEAVEFEVVTAPSELGIKESKWTPTQARFNDLREHLDRKHSLG